MSQDVADSDRAELADAFRAFIQQGEALLAQKADEAGESAVQARARLEVQVAEARKRLVALEARIAERAKAAAKDTDQYVREHPWQSVGIAAGAGLILGLLIGRR